MVYDSIYGLFESEQKHTEFLEEHLGYIDFDKPPIDANYEIPYEMYEYYVENNYAESQIPLNLKTAQEIFNILKKQKEIEEDVTK